MKLRDTLGRRVAVQGIHKRFAGAGRAALDDVSLSVAPGSIFALLGPSGSGKTTLLRIIAGFETPDAGTVIIGDRVVCGPSARVAPEKRGIGFVFQHAALFPHLTVRENILFGMHGFPKPTQKAALAHVTELCALPALLDRYPHELSGGEQQRAAMARAMARGNGVVLLDEPMSSIDASLRAEMGAELRTILRESGTTAILVTHDQAEALAFADVVGVMREGRIEQIDTPQNVYVSPVNPAVGSFLGAANFVPATLSADELRTEIGCFICARMQPMGERLEVMLRPNELAVARDDGGSAFIDDTRFTGATWLYTVRLASGNIVRCEMPAPGHAPIEPGARVRVSSSVSRPLVFPADRD